MEQRICKYPLARIACRFSKTHDHLKIQATGIVECCAPGSEFTRCKYGVLRDADGHYIVQGTVETIPLEPSTVPQFIKPILSFGIPRDFP